MVQVRLFGTAREAAGASVCDLQGETVEEVLRAACVRFGDALGAVLEHSTVWVNGEPASAEHALVPSDELAVLPPVSGG